MSGAGHTFLEFLHSIAVVLRYAIARHPVLDDGVVGDDGDDVFLARWGGWV